MSTGDVQDFKNRLIANLPNKNASDFWFGEEYPILNALLTGFATTDSFIYSLFDYVRAQMRIQTATDENLDIHACDYFGTDVSRVFGLTSDSAFRRYILATLIQEEATRKGMFNAILNLTGYPPIIIEPWNGGDTGAYDIPVWGFNTHGGFGAYAPYNFWITVFADAIEETKHAGLNTNAMGFNIFGSGSKGGYLAAGQDDNGGLTDDQILEVIRRVKVYGTVEHVTIIRVAT